MLILIKKAKDLTKDLQFRVTVGKLGADILKSFIKYFFKMYIIRSSAGNQTTEVPVYPSDQILSEGVRF